MVEPAANRHPRIENRRKFQRYAVGDRTTLRLFAESQVYSCALDDISLDGARLMFDVEPSIMGPVRLEHPFSGEFLAEPVWQEAGMLGVKFQLSARALTHALQCISLTVFSDSRLRQP